MSLALTMNTNGGAYLCEYRAQMGAGAAARAAGRARVWARAQRHLAQRLCVCEKVFVIVSMGGLHTR